VNERLGKVWSLPFKGVDPTGADDYFFYLKNDGTTNIRITDIRISSTVAGLAELQIVTGTASGGSAITPVGRNLGIPATLVATVESGADITGLTNGGILFFLPMDTANKEQHLTTSSRVIIPPGSAVALLWPESTGILTGVVSIVEETAGNTDF
jgi:hypothetical protein